MAEPCHNPDKVGESSEPSAAGIPSFPLDVPAGTDAEPQGNAEANADTASLEKIRQELAALRQENKQLTEQLNDPKRNPKEYLPSFLKETAKVVTAETQTLAQEFSAVKEQLASLQAKTEELGGSVIYTRDFVQKVEDERVKTLYAENEKYKAGLVKRFEDELLTNVVREIDEAERTIRRIEEKDAAELTAEEVFAAAQEIIADFKDMLQDRFGLTPYISPIGSAADSQHRITPRRETTADNELNGKIAKSVTCGYKDKDGKVFRQESVVLYKYEPAVIQAINAALSENTQDTGTVVGGESENTR